MTDKMKQEQLFAMDEIPVVPPAPQPTRWYYITRRRNTEMLHYISRDGTPVWCEHDTRSVQPMVFNSAHTAKLDMRRHGGNEIKRWYWSVKRREMESEVETDDSG